MAFGDLLFEQNNPLKRVAVLQLDEQRSSSLGEFSELLLTIGDRLDVLEDEFSRRRYRPA